MKEVQSIENAQRNKGQQYALVKGQVQTALRKKTCVFLFFPFPFTRRWTDKNRPWLAAETSRCARWRTLSLQTILPVQTRRNTSKPFSSLSPSAFFPFPSLTSSR